MFAPGAIPLDQEASRVSSPSGTGSEPPFTLIFVTCCKVQGTLFAFQNAVRSLSAGKVSIRIAIVCPFPVTPTASALYALSTSATRYGGEFAMLGEGPSTDAVSGTRESRLSPLGQLILKCLWARRKGCNPMIA